MSALAALLDAATEPTVTFSIRNPGARTSTDVITVRRASAYGLRTRMFGFVTTRRSR